MLFSRLYLLLLLLINLFPANAQLVPVTRYTTRDGMFTERIICMTQDSKGYMWFGTYFGIMRYDGYKWIKIQLPEHLKNKFVNSIRAVGEKVYAGIGLNGGLILINELKAEQIKLPSPLSEVTAITVNEDSSISLVAKQISGDSMAVLNYKNNSIKYLWKLDKAYENINAICSDKKQRTWIGTKKGLIVLDGKKLIQVIKDTTIESLSLNQNGSMVVISSHGQKFSVRFYDTKSLFVKNRIITNDLLILPQYENNESGTWGSVENKIIHLNENGLVKHYPFELPKRTVTGPIFIDREKTVWFATEAGLYKFANLHVQSFYFEEKGPTSTFILQLPSQKLITNGFAFYSLKVEKDAVFRKLMPMMSPSSNMFLDSKNNIWVAEWAGQNGISLLNINKGSIGLKKHFKTYGSYFTEDSDGNIWTTGMGITIFKMEKVLQQIPMDVQLTNFHLDEGNHTIWAGTSFLGILKIKYAINANGKYSFKIVDRIDQSNGLKDHTIRGNLFKDSKGRLWVGTRNSGISFIDEKNGKYRIRNFSEEEGIACSRINWITEHKGCIWAAACDGIYQIKDTLVVRKWNTGDGLIEDYVLHLTFDADTMWVGTSEGITKVLISENKIITPPIVNLADVRVLGISDSSLNKEKRLSFKASQNSIGFSFTGNSFIDEKRTIYRYRLVGYDEEWSEPTSINHINYASLPPGTYQFEVHAQNAKGVWSSSPAVFKFDIIQPFYKNTWFIILSIAVLILLFLLIRNYRIQQKYKLEKLRMTIARDLHDDIGSALGSINILSKTAVRKIETDKQIKAVVDKIGLTAQSTLESMDEIIWTINPVKERNIDLVIRMQNFAQPLLESEEIKFYFESMLSPDKKLEMNLKKNLYLIFKEIIYNAIKHADCSKIEVKLWQQQHNIILLIKDDGKGITNTLGNTNGNGLGNISTRARSCGGNVEICTGKTSGTSVKVTVSTI